MNISPGCPSSVKRLLSSCLRFFTCVLRMSASGPVLSSYGKRNVSRKCLYVMSSGSQGLSVARRPTGSQNGVFPFNSMRPQQHSLNSMLTMLCMDASWTASDMRMVLFRSTCRTTRFMLLQQQSVMCSSSMQSEPDLSEARYRRTSSTASFPICMNADGFTPLPPSLSIRRVCSSTYLPSECPISGAEKYLCIAASELCIPSRAMGSIEFEVPSACYD
mmetsp:Transcript_13064/g.36751  ORF Transcript_13064/g.36751 Transcript_13064/m.36751 type:complete len:218 (-) Transcript_13064:429-1082(-)